MEVSLWEQGYPNYGTVVILWGLLTVISDRFVVFNGASTVMELSCSQNDYVVFDACKAYLPGRSDTTIMKVVHLGRGPTIALRLG